MVLPTSWFLTPSLQNVRQYISDLYLKNGYSLNRCVLLLNILTSCRISTWHVFAIDFGWKEKGEWWEAGSRQADPGYTVWLWMVAWVNLMHILLTCPFEQMLCPQPPSQCCLPSSSSVSPPDDCRDILTDVSTSLLRSSDPLSQSDISAM